MRLGGFVDISTIDWYGNVSLVVFFAGCNFRCPYCQNSGLLPMDSGSEIDGESLCSRIEINMKPVPELDAVVLTGGEPTLQADGVFEASKIAREHGLKVMLDTNGSNPEVLKQLLEAGLVDRVALDVKAPLNPEDYGKVSGVVGRADNIVRNIRRTLELCEAYNVEVEARTTVAPTVSDSDAFIRGIARDIRGHYDVYFLQQFDNTGEVLSPELKALTPPTRERLIELARVAVGEGLDEVYIKTRALGLERVDC